MTIGQTFVGGIFWEEILKVLVEATFNYPAKV